jgi:DNA-binding transcriptional LysR family regulator
LFPVRVLAAMSPRHRLARHATIDLTDLQGERVLLLRQGFGTREMFDGACRIAHVHTRAVLETGDPQSLIALVEAARGIAIVPSTVLFTGRKVHVAPVLHARASPGMWGWIVWDPKRFLQAFARSFIEGLVEYTRRTYPGRAFERRAPPVPRPKEEEWEVGGRRRFGPARSGEKTDYSGRRTPHHAPHIRRDME